MGRSISAGKASSEASPRSMFEVSFASREASPCDSDVKLAAQCGQQSAARRWRYTFVLAALVRFNPIDFLTGRAWGVRAVTCRPRDQPIGKHLEVRCTTIASAVDRSARRRCPSKMVGNSAASSPPLVLRWSSERLWRLTTSGRHRRGHPCFETVGVSGIRKGHIRYSDIRATRPIADQYRRARDATLAIPGVARA